jgi:exonuclease SbcC
MKTLYNKLKINLEGFLRDRQPQIEAPPPNTAPLFLLLTVKPNLIGFATLDSKPDENFSKAFQNFKDLYSIHSSEWADLDLTLVLCKTDTEKIPDEFCNKIEIDPYFCQKFVIDLTNLEAELARLPFIPLRPETIVGLKRPISAQSFLMKHGVNANLAKYLIVPHARGIKRIADECIKGVLGKSEWLKTEIKEYLLPQQEISQEVRIKDLEISGFRAYRGNYKFHLDADLIVLFGPNGLGKTSFFDAIDFVSTGGVTRFDERFGRKTDRLLRALKHLDFSMDDSFVKVKISTGDKEVTVERYIKDRTNALVNGSPKDRKKTFMLLTGLSKEPPDIRIENLIRLFRATHLFGQEYQSLTSGIRQYSKLPEDTVSRMLAIQDYVEGISKAKEVSEEVKRQIRNKEFEISSLNNSLSSKEVEIKQISTFRKIAEKPEAVSAMGKKIGEKISKLIGVPVEIPKEFNKEVIREWRIKIAVQKSSITQSLELIEKLEHQFPELVNQRKKLYENSLKLAQKKELLINLNRDYSKKINQTEESSVKLRTMLTEERDLSSKRDNLNWLLQARIEYQKFKEQLAKEEKNYRALHKKLLGLSPKIEKLQFENKASEEAIGKIATDMKILEKELKEVGDFERSVGDWLKAMNRHKELKVNLQRTRQELDNVKTELRIKRDELNAALIDRDKLRKHIDDLQKNQTELQTLLDNIERHILNSICPVCGTQHRSREELIEKLRFQRGIQPKEIQEALKLFEDEKAKTNNIENCVKILQLRLMELEQKVEEAEKELLDIEKNMRIFEEKANSLDILGAPEDLSNIIDSKKKRISEQINMKNQELSEQKAKTKKFQEELVILLKQQENLEGSLRTLKSRQNQISSMINQIISNASNRQLSLELEKETIQHELTATNNMIDGLRKQIEMQQTQNQNLQKVVCGLLEKKNSLEREIQELDKGILASMKYIEAVESLIKSLINSLGLNLDADMKQILDHKKDLIEKLISSDLLQNEIVNFESALDTVETSAALAKIQQDIKNINKQLQALEKERNQLNDWLSYFDIISKELELLQNQALKEYTEKYGPLTSTIQRRLRSVYGFGGIKIHPEKVGIAVRVERKEEKNISPSDYFSESQIQILMLSLFLSATLTQTWSSFAPVLLDDPVEHFDDLNAYSFLDLIRGLIMEPGRKRQFIISTCDDRLFRLMRQKFSKINGRAIFYVFESIGENGPKIKKMENG